eukprot:scaffold257_cov422-Prasinococcus_capsulatus_cf.AAC.2
MLFVRPPFPLLGDCVWLANLRETSSASEAQIRTSRGTRSKDPARLRYYAPWLQLEPALLAGLAVSVPVDSAQSV